MTEPYQERLAKSFEARNRLHRFEPDTQDDIDAMVTQTAPNGERFKEVYILNQLNRMAAEHALSICLDSFHDTWKAGRIGKSGITVYWRIMPEVCQSESRPFLWRGYARLVLG